MADRAVIGWDIGGAHVKACLTRRGLVHDAAQWPCPLWQGAEHLDRVLALALERWPDLADAHHAVTMTGEMVDRFAHREDGVRRIAEQLAAVLHCAAVLRRRCRVVRGVGHGGVVAADCLGQLAGECTPHRVREAGRDRACWSTSVAPPPT